MIDLLIGCRGECIENIGADSVIKLQQQLHEKDLKLTDIQLEALSSAHQLEQLKGTMIRMKVGSFFISY